ncbi:unnamed protein product [Absidia cylindrospora]
MALLKLSRTSKLVTTALNHGLTMSPFLDFRPTASLVQAQILQISQTSPPASVRYEEPASF